MHNAGMIYGYARVSTDAQDLTSQLAQLKAAGCEKVFREKITGTTADRPQLKKLMRNLAPGDVVKPAVSQNTFSGSLGNRTRQPAVPGSSMAPRRRMTEPDEIRGAVQPILLFGYV
jgi:hypothetical protein